MIIQRAPAWYNAGSDYRTRINQAPRLLDSQLLTLGTTDGTDVDLFYNGTNAVIDVNAGDLNVDIAGGDMNFQQTTNILTTSGGLTLTPNNGTVTIIQGANDDTALNLRNSDVAHGLTSSLGPTLNTGDYMSFRKLFATGGGVEFAVITDGDATSGPVLAFLVASRAAADTTRSTAGRSFVEVISLEHDGANGLANVTANGNVFGVRARTGGSQSTVFIVDEDGDIWSNGATITMPNLQSAAAATNVSYNTTTKEFQQDTSARHWKENIEPMQDWRSILSSLRPVAFDWKEGISMNGLRLVGRQDLGLVAEEAAAVDPRLATWNGNDEVQSVRYQLLTVPLVAGWQDHEARLRALEVQYGSNHS